MSAKLRLSLWLTLMVLLLAGVVLLYILVLNSRDLPDDPARYLVDVVLDNADDVEFDNGRFDWHDLHVYKRGVYCSFYDDAGQLLMAALPEGTDLSAFPFAPNILRTVELNGREHFLYDCYVNMAVSGLWIRGVTATDSRAGVRESILILSASLLPALLLLTFVGGWLIAWLTFRPLGKIQRAVNSIEQGEDLSARIDLQRGPKEFRRLAAAFDRMAERLEASFLSERQFASDASHELRTPTTVILAECDRARRKAETPEDYQSSLRVIEEQGQHMSQLIQQLLSLTRIQQGTDRYPLRKLELSELVRACCEEFVPSETRGITLHTDIAPGVFAAVNSTLYSRAVYNLLENAYKYGRPGGQVWLSLRSEQGHALLRVRDDGPGIAPADQEKIWQRFWQADVSRGEDGGSGLGLSMVREIARFHGGEAKVESSPGEGSCFILSI